jgi:hypothetical protein
MKRAFVQQFQNSYVKKVNWSPARSHFVMQVFASLSNRRTPPPHAPLAVSNVPELRLETCANVFGQDTLLTEKPNNDPLVVLHPLNEKPETDGPHDNNSKGTADLIPL